MSYECNFIEFKRTKVPNTDQFTISLFSNKDMRQACYASMDKSSPDNFTYCFIRDHTHHKELPIPDGLVQWWTEYLTSMGMPMYYKGFDTVDNTLKANGLPSHSRHDKKESYHAIEIRNWEYCPDNRKDNKRRVIMLAALGLLRNLYEDESTELLGTLTSVRKYEPFVSPKNRMALVSLMQAYIIKRNEKDAAPFLGDGHATINGDKAFLFTEPAVFVHQLSYHHNSIQQFTFLINTSKSGNGIHHPNYAGVKTAILNESIPTDILDDVLSKLCVSFNQYFLKKIPKEVAQKNILDSLAEIK